MIPLLPPLVEFMDPASLCHYSASYTSLHASLCHYSRGERGVDNATPAPDDAAPEGRLRPGVLRALLIVS